MSYHSIYKIILVIAIGTILVSCDSGEYINSEYVEVRSRKESPNKKYVAVVYRVDIGATGYRGPFSAIVPIESINHDLRQYSLPEEYSFRSWSDDNTANVHLYIYPHIKNGRKIIKHEEHMGVILNIKPNDCLKNYKKKIIKRKTSPDNKRELVAFRYIYEKHCPWQYGSHAKSLHIAKIEKGAQLPKYANIFLGDPNLDYLYDYEWNGNNSVIFFTNKKSGWHWRIKTRFIKNNALKYEIMVDENRFKDQGKMLKATL